MKYHRKIYWHLTTSSMLLVFPLALIAKLYPLWFIIVALGLEGFGFYLAMYISDKVKEEAPQ